MWTHYLFSWALPSLYTCNTYVKRAKYLLMPEIQRRLQAEQCEKSLPENDNVLSWMMEIATSQEKNPEQLAHLEVVISLAAIHTSQTSAVHCLYDLIVRPEYIELIREEVRQIVNEDGPWTQWKKPSFAKLKHLDSFMRESQRFNPPAVLSMRRMMVQDHQLNDGTILPQGAHVSVPASAIQNDPEVTPEPDVFNGDRYFKLRQKEGQTHLHQFATADQKNLNFGFGSYACPGRFYASLLIKLILVRLIMEFDFQLPAGKKGRPENLRAHEFIFPDPDGEILIRARKASEGSGRVENCSRE